ncbi:MAG: hypothetical protein IH800_00375 [Myxococcales bacterium]|nr:hypothetical protein [Myxococcales bacterium]
MDREELLYLSDLNLAESAREWARGSGGSIVEEAGSLLTAGPLAHPILNNAVRTEPSLDAGEFMRRTAEFYARCGHGYSLTLAQHGQNSDLVKAAREAGLSSILRMPAMLVEAPLQEVPVPSGAELRRVVDADGVEDFRKVAAEAWTTYGIPPEVTATVFSNDATLLAPHVIAVVSYIEATPLCAALALLSHGIAGIYWVSSVSGARGRGLGEACTRVVTNAGFDLGARAVSLQASPMGDAIYRRMGYVELSNYHMLWSPPPDPALTAKGGA